MIMCVAHTTQASLFTSYAIAEKKTNQYVGSCGYAPYENGTVEFYYSVNKDETGKGIATETISELAKELSKEVVVRAYCHPDNYAAHSVAWKSGFVPKGVHEHKNFVNAGELFIYKRSSNGLHRTAVPLCS